MSRCFPYPPPGYLINGVRGEAVRDSIKLQKVKEDPITEHVNKKRKDRKERKEKKDKKRNDKGNQKHGYMVDIYNTSEKSLLPKGKEVEAERSDLTEEHEQPVSALNACHSPDSGGRDNKRKLDHSGSITKSRGNVLRIRLPLQRHSEAGTSLGAERLSSNSGNVASFAQPAETSTAPRREECRPVSSSTEAVCKSVEDFRVADSTAKVNNAKTHSASLHKRKEHKVESLYKSLIENWIPPPLEMDQTNFDDSWLHQSEERDQLGCKRLKSSQDYQPCHESTNLWPFARFLAEADVYALPYSVPF